MNTRRHIVVCIMAVSLVACLGANAARNVVRAPDESDNAFWIQTKLSDELLASRLNVTNVPKALARMPGPDRTPRKTARLTR
ncbi:hypothetical protein [Methyloceanibacter sp.]|uniref:hypothetical protein n=1 Tax=Methyloceanibacter sp. TaxID=1965321 RepID=UPI002D1FBEA0|nr:hypothetical protein [Methyloceanibacter sp.]